MKKKQHHKWQLWVKYVMFLKMFLSCWQCTVRVVPQVGEVYSKLRVPVSVEDRLELALQGLCLPYWGRSMLGNRKTHSSCGQKVVPWPVGGTWEITQPINFWPSWSNDSSTLIIKELNQISAEHKNKILNTLLLTDVGYLICHHVFIVVDSGIWNMGLVSHRHYVQFLMRTKQKKTLSGYVKCWTQLHLFHVSTYYFYTDI